jgi:hypothetical protein
MFGILLQNENINIHLQVSVHYVVGVTMIDAVQYLLYTHTESILNMDKVALTPRPPNRVGKQRQKNEETSALCS